MAAPDNSPHLKRVLRSYQNSAMSSLHGPGPNCYLNDTGRMGVSKKVADCDDDRPSIKQLDATTKHELYRGISYKKALLYEVDHKKNKVENGPRRCIVDIESRRLQTSSLPTNHTPTAGPQPTQPDCKDTSVDITTTTTTTASLVRNSASDTATTCNSANITTSASDSTTGVEESWVEPGVFLAPAPFPPQPWPVLAAADKGSPGAGWVRETLLDGEPITCFNVGGEMRLCLPQILNTVLRDFSLSQINAVCEELRIYLDGCNEAQLDALRVAGVLPHCAPSCGLITNTDAQRLTQALLYAHPTRAPVPDPSKPQDHPKLRVYHTCFGKCKGLVWDDLYTNPNAACIECEECHGLLPPARFVCHAHRSLENQTIHWGFDAEQWRTYLLLAKDQQLPLEKAEAQLKGFKSKFDPVGANYKRKQVSLAGAPSLTQRGALAQDRVETKEELPKKVRAEEAPTPFTTYDPMLSYMWRCASMVPPWTAAPLVTRDGKPLPPPPPAFVRDSVPAPLPAYLSQGPPVLADPGRVVPLSDSQKFERHYQPNVALAPPKVRDKTLRNSLPLSDHCHDVPIKHQMYAIEDCIKRENSPTILPCSQPSSQHSVVSKLTQTNNHYHNPHHHHHHLPRKLCSPDTSGRHPELELSTTDSDTDSVGSLANHSETVEEAEGLLRGWSDRAAAGKVRQLVANLVADLAASNRQKAALKQRMEAMTRDHSHAVVTLQSQILASTQLSKESQFREKLCVMEEELRVRPTHSVITPISPVKTEPSEVIDTC
ncbi:uncharacterized protein LOC123499485 isoform X3 [Portunus trituberculatus]|uniref:uncharacterized protein LOC123499485 isoform X3 n=1 Tax=Portunus trituberculatus TaxID=210409 RepID=UPI001E1CB989|nr:uncharacterized protein LOC123499485 isoform X3 [Portunus trituberculatus]